MIKRRGLTSKQMSKLHKEARLKGYTKKEAWKAVGRAKVLSKRIPNSKLKKTKMKKDPYLDYDGDGKVNRYDCRPLDKKRQDEDEETPEELERKWNEMKKEDQEAVNNRINRMFKNKIDIEEEIEKQKEAKTEKEKKEIEKRINKGLKQEGYSKEEIKNGFARAEWKVNQFEDQ